MLSFARKISLVFGVFIQIQIEVFLNGHFYIILSFQVTLFKRAFCDKQSKAKADLNKFNFFIP